MSEYYFSARPDTPFERESFTTTVWGHELTVETGAGVFSRGHLDHATAVLLRELDPPAQGHFLDLGCGYGIIGLAIARAVPLASVIGVDVNERAIALANDNAAALGVAGRFVACTGDRVPSDQAFDEIWSNPPIRIGKAALHELLRQWLPRLSDHGVAHLVVQRNLGSDSLARWIESDLGMPCARLASHKGFRILEVRPARP